MVMVLLSDWTVVTGVTHVLQCWSVPLVMIQSYSLTTLLLTLLMKPLILTQLSPAKIRLTHCNLNYLAPPLYHLHRQKHFLLMFNDEG